MDAWRLIVDPPSPAGYNMAVDEALAHSCRSGRRGPTLRLYAWEGPAISLGYFQRPDHVVDLDRCRDAGVAVVRRTTGGRAVYHLHEVTYSVVAPVPSAHFPPTIRGTYEVVARVLEAALTALGCRVERRDRDLGRRHQTGGSPLCFDAVSRNEITIAGEKVVGSAQRRWPHAFLQHGSILLRWNPSEAAPWLRNAGSGRSAVTGICASRNDLTRNHVCEALIAGWERAFRTRLLPDALSSTEADAVAESSHERDLTVTQAV